VSDPAAPRILYCNCSYAKVVPNEVKEEVLRKLCASGTAFDAVADLCDMSARKDPALKKLVESGAVRIAACYPRAVRWLFHAAGTPLPKEGVEILNMREQTAEAVVGALFAAPGEKAAT
jgi:heterodisulfide reductase subunit A-like polyferredoxin